ncbi:MAG: hypothetical protein HFI68_03915 [Lachnospiraceae bacterium]|nr:hypothetical protein [Lachnospiraceae bacterium]
MKIGNTGLKQVCIVTWDLKKAEEHWSRILDMPAKHLMTPPWSEVPSYTDGKADSFREPFILYRLENDVILEIFGPGETAGNPWRRYLEKHGEGVMNLAFYVDGERPDAYKQIGGSSGTAMPYHEGFYPDTTYSFVDTGKELGVELNIKCVEDNTERIRTFRENPDSYQNR